MSAKKITGYLCYSESDETAVQRLRRRLSRYAVPPALRGGAPAQLGRFIPVRQTPRAEEEVKQQLASAEWLIVCCSPASFASARVNEEIDAYIRLNAGARILMLLVEGEPREVLAPRLRAREPVTADFRSDGDGAELGFLKLVAALRGLNLGALRDQQAAQARARDRAASALAAALAVLAVAGWGVSVTAMRERDQSAAMAAAAIDIGAGLAAQTEDPSASEEQFERLFANGVHTSTFVLQRAELLVRFAEFYQRRGEKDLSDARARAAIAAFETLPENQRRSLDFAQALSLVSQAEAEAGRDDEAVDYAARAVDVARAIPRTGDGAAERAVFAAALGRLGQLHLRANRPAEALPFLAEAVAALEASPASGAAGFAALDALGDAQAAGGDWASARASFERAVALARAAHEGKPADAPTYASLGAGLLKLGQATNEAGDAPAARAPLEESLAIARIQAAAAPDDNALRDQLNSRLLLTAQVQASLGRASGEILAEAIAAARRLNQNGQAGVAAKQQLAALLTADAARLRRANDFAGARGAWRDAAQVVRELRARGGAGAESHTVTLAALSENIAEASRSLDDRPGALSAYGDAVRFRRAALEPAPQNRGARAALAQTLHTLAQVRARADNAAGARAAFDEAARLRVALANEDESDAAIANLAIESLRRLAQAQQAANNEEGARRSLDTVRDLRARQAQANLGAAHATPAGGAN